jgi:DNA-binding transcriptional MerR regulator
MSRVRDHWSIGEVLALLQDEFPEVTISKIRFLESQGLIDPERTASGYRKFSDTDYDRLYWILEQQRDNYLPLRVIRDRLDEGQEIGTAPRRSDLRLGDQIDDDEESVESDPDESELDGSFSDALADVTGPVASADAVPHPVRDESSNALAGAMGVGGELNVSTDEQTHSEMEGESLSDTEEVPQGEETTLGVDTSSLDQPELPGSDTIADYGTAEVGEAAEVGDTAEVGTAPQPSEETHDDQENGADHVTKKPAPRLLGTRSEGPRPVTRTTAEALAPPPRPSLPGSSVALTGEELAEQSGTTPGMIADLQKFGMISPRLVGGTVLFDSTALTVTRLAVQFGRYGLEPRHLKTFRLGAEREVALLTQSIGPTLKANNPETRRRSYDTLLDLTELTASLRSIIVRDLVADLEPGG